MRMTYGHGGTRLERIRVAAPPADPTAAPRWLRLLLLAVWLIVPLLVGRYAIPTTPQQTTVIDASRLEVIPPPVIPEPPRVEPVEPPPPPPAPVQNAQQSPERLPEELPPPTITRPAAARVPDTVPSQPRIVRQRARDTMETGTPADPHVRRATATTTEVPVERTTITRTRGAAAAEAPAASERVAALRRVPVSEGPKAEAGASLRPFTRRERTSVAEATSAPRVVATRDRGTAPGEAVDPRASALALSRGVSFASLEICSSPSEQEEKITAVLGVVGARRSCRDETGEYQFKGTQRISSFNLIIFPAKGRRPTNRCEELENAYRCLKTR